MSKKIFKLINISLIIFIFLTGCNLPQLKKLSEQDITGVWKQVSNECENNLPECAQFIFTEDGRFEAKNIPDEYFGYGIVKSESVFDASGEWQLEINPDSFGWSKINMRFDPISEMNYPSYNTDLYVSGSNGNYHVFEWHGDPDNRITFIRNESTDK